MRTLEQPRELEPINQAISLEQLQKAMKNQNKKLLLLVHLIKYFLIP